MSQQRPAASGILQSIGHFIGEVAGGRRQAEQFGESDYRLAAAALLVHVVTSDHEFDEAQRAKLVDVLAYRFELGQGEAEKLVAAAVKADREAVDLYHFTSVLDHALDEEGRRRVIEMMFEIAYTDGKLSEFEDNIIWRASELLNIPARDRVSIRRHVRDETAEDENK
jgi:uncharacterized tellurite resistance protein B-like protein